MYVHSCMMLQTTCKIRALRALVFTQEGANTSGKFQEGANTNPRGQPYNIEKANCQGQGGGGQINSKGHPCPLKYTMPMLVVLYASDFSVN